MDDGLGSLTVAVVGMHRSGTSAVAQLLSVNGWDAGPPAGLYGPSPWNRLGHFEDIQLHELNERMLADLGGSWRLPPPIERVHEASEELADRYQHALRERLVAIAAGPRVVKDPRLSLLLPVWQRCVPGIRYVVCLRDPASVAGSLKARDRLPAHVALALWEHYNVAAAQALRGSSAIWVDLARLRAQQGRTELLSALGAPVSDVVDTFDTGELERWRGAEPPLAVPEELTRLHELLRSGDLQGPRPAPDISSSSQEVLEEARRGEAELRDAVTARDDAERRVEQERGRSEALRQALDAIEIRLAEAHATIAGMGARHSAELRQARGSRSTESDGTTEEQYS